jgi:hypothetical protein
MTNEILYGHKVEGREVSLYGINDGDLYRQCAVPIIRNLARKMLKGEYDPALAVRAFRVWADRASAAYAKEFKVTGHGKYGFAVKSREVAAAEALEHYGELILAEKAILKADAHNRRVWTLSEIKYRNEEGGGYFFSHETMRFFGDTMKNFAVDYSVGKVYVYRRKAGTKAGPNLGERRLFNPENGHIGSPIKD